MPELRIGRLRDVTAREAWANEAHDFTPWLAENLDQLSEAIGCRLELTGREVAVDRFAADILARNTEDDTAVLIENQLTRTDHEHLGQILTYLAGLEARTVIWIAPEFRDPHLSAIQWLNQNTAEGFAFFAVRQRVVRIGEGPMAPIFEVLEKPNSWERRLQRVAREVAGDSLGDLRSEFWSFYLQRHPEAAGWGLKPARLSNSWAPLSADERIWLSLWIGRTNSGAFVRGPYGGDPAETEALLAPLAEALEARLGVPFGGPPYFLTSRLPVPVDDRADWPRIVDWMEQSRRRYAAAFASLLAAP
jgi:hypothetical protein